MIKGTNDIVSQDREAIEITVVLNTTFINGNHSDKEYNELN